MVNEACSTTRRPPISTDTAWTWSTHLGWQPALQSATRVPDDLYHAVVEHLLRSKLAASDRWIVVGPIACACAVAAGAVYLAGHDPLSPAGSVLPCPLYVSTGLYCPGCGLTRAAYALLHGQVGRAFGYNLFFPLFFGALMIGWWAWMRSALGLRPLQWLARLPTSVPVVAGGILLGFAVLRNLTPFSALAP